MNTKTVTLILAALALLVPSFNASAQTYTWADNAQGQIYQICPNLNPEAWPSNSLWSQSLAYGANCDNTAMVVSQPSNWDPAPPAGVYPGGPGAVGVDVLLGPPANTDIESASATVNRLTLQTNGALYLGYFGSVTATTVDIQGDATIHAGAYAGELNIVTGGSLTKSGGNGTLSFGLDGYGNAVSLNAVNASLVIQSGTFSMPYKGAGGWFGGAFCVSNNATVVLNVENTGDPSLCDTITGVGGGTVLMTAPVRTYGYDFHGLRHDGLTLNFPAKMFQWSGGYFDGTATNLGILNLSTNPATSTSFFNDGSMLLADGGSFSVNGNQPFNNQPDGTVDLQGDASVQGTGSFANYGLLKKSAGSGRSQVLPRFYSYGGTVEADAGTLALNLATGGYITNASFVVSNGATLELSISNYTTEIEGTLNGSGGGTVLVNNGTLNSYSGAVLNFPGSMFQWAGGLLNSGSSATPIANLGTINLLGPVAFSGYTLENNGTITQGANGSVANGGGSSTIHNATTGIYQLQNDGSIGTAYFNNDGLFEKNGGTGTNTITSIFNNTGTITANTGAIAFAGTFNQNDGTLTLTPALLFTAPNYNVNLNGGTITGVGMIGNNGYTLYLQGGTLAPGNPFGTMAVSMQNGLYMYPAAAMSFFIGGASQFSELDLTANPYASYLGGTLNVTLTNGYVPPVGTQFHIITGKVSGGFSTLNVPPGMAVTYSNSTGVYLTMIGSTPVQIQPPALSGGQLTFGFGTTNGLAYTVEQNSDLSTTNWTYYTNLIGDGSLYQVTAPVTNIPQMFFRVRQP